MLSRRGASRLGCRRSPDHFESGCRLHDAQQLPPSTTCGAPTASEAITTPLGPGVATALTARARGIAGGVPQRSQPSAAAAHDGDSAAGDEVRPADQAVGSHGAGAARGTGGGGSSEGRTTSRPSRERSDAASG